ncbi:hypothetical protein CBM2633_B90392 [Cupriavidus taiwanensis]|nr:hypothetical protein CBM2633_B90392 [Cupriavidus taiwanensis]
MPGCCETNQSRWGAGDIWIDSRAAFGVAPVSLVNECGCVPVLGALLATAAGIAASFLQDLDQPADHRRQVGAFPVQHTDMTSRTLHRRLAGEGTSVRKLQEEVRESLADELLESGLTLTQVGEALGYGEVSNFIRAYRRWKGLTPHQSRKRMQGSA